MPSFYPEGNTPQPQDSELRCLQKIVGLLASVQVNETGSGSPEGVITATPGRIYVDTSDPLIPHIYVKGSGTGNTGWRLTV